MFYHFDYQHDTREEYEGALIGFDADHNAYCLISVTYEAPLATFILEEGPGWIAQDITFLDVTDARTLANFLDDLVSTSC